MAFNMATSGPGWRLAGSLIQLGNEIQATHPNLTCLGTLGNAAHVAEGTASDHNPFVHGPDGVGVVRAMDIGGPVAELLALRATLAARYFSQDDRLWIEGYLKGPDSNITNRGLPAGYHSDGGDEGHLHVSVTRNGLSYAPAIDDTRNWGVGSPAPIPADTVPFKGAAWPGPQLGWGPGDYFGLITGPKASHGGFYANEQPYVRMIQQRLIAFGFVPGVTDWRNGWADGKFEEPTRLAVVRFQARYRPGAQTSLPGQFWSDDWRTLFSL